MRAVFIPMIEFEKLEKVIEHAELTVTHFRSLVNSMDDETYDKFDGTPIGELFDNLIDLEDYIGLSK